MSDFILADRKTDYLLPPSVDDWLTHGHIVKLEAQLRQEVQELLALAEDADTANIPDGMSLPKRTQTTRRPPGGKPPTAPEPGAKDSDQINLTDEESRIMALSGGEFEQCYNTQAGVDAHTMLVVATTLTQAPNDKQQVQPMLKVLQEQSAKLGTVTTLIPVARQDHHPHWSERFTEPAPLKAGATPMQAMTHRLTTLASRADDAIRKQTVKPVFGIIKSVMGFRQFSLRGLRKVTGGLPGLECQTHGRATSKNWTRGQMLHKICQKVNKQVVVAYFLSNFKTGRILPLLCPTGC